MKTLYIYVLDTLADWELGHLLSEVKSKRFFKKNAEVLDVMFVGASLNAIKTMGGCIIHPDILVDAIELNENHLLVLPGAETWSDPMHQAIITIAEQYLTIGAGVAAICGATTALAEAGILNNRKHTSNGEGFLEMFAEHYHGSKFYRNERSLSNANLITAGSAGTLLWTKHILEYLDVFHDDSLEYWFRFFETGDATQYFALMKSLR